MQTFTLLQHTADGARLRRRPRRRDVDVWTKDAREVDDICVYDFDGAQVPSVPDLHARRRRSARGEANQSRRRLGRRRQKPRVQIVIDRFQMTEKLFIEHSARRRREISHRLPQTARR